MHETYREKLRECGLGCRGCVLVVPRTERMRQKQWLDGEGYLVVVKLYYTDERDAFQVLWIGQWRVRNC